MAKIKVSALQTIDQLIKEVDKIEENMFQSLY